MPAVNESQPFPTNLFSKQKVLFDFCPDQDFLNVRQLLSILRQFHHWSNTLPELIPLEYIVRFAILNNQVEGTRVNIYYRFSIQVLLHLPKSNNMKRSHRKKNVY